MSTWVCHSTGRIYFIRNQNSNLLSQIHRQRSCLVVACTPSLEFQSFFITSMISMCFKTFSLIIDMNMYMNVSNVLNSCNCWNDCFFHFFFLWGELWNCNQEAFGMPFVMPVVCFNCIRNDIVRQLKCIQGLM